MGDALFAAVFLTGLIHVKHGIPGAWVIFAVLLLATAIISTTCFVAEYRWRRRG